MPGKRGVAHELTKMMNEEGEEAARARGRILDAFREAGVSKEKAAKILNMSTATLWRLVDRADHDAPGFRVKIETIWHAARALAREKKTTRILNKPFMFAPLVRTAQNLPVVRFVQEAHLLSA